MDPAATTPLSRLYARRAEGFRPSPVRSVFEVSMEPGMVSFAGGNPDIGLLPLGSVADIAARVVRERGLDALQYGSGGGAPELGRTAALVMAAEGIAVDPADVLVTSGSQMALELVTTLFVDPGDVVLAESPTYVGAISAFAGLEADVVQVACDADGLDPRALAEAIDAARTAGRTVKLLYTIPNFANPSGTTTSEVRRREVLAVCRAAGVLVVEDNPYGLTSFSGTFGTSLYSLDPGNVLYLGTFSKIFSPGVRVGWVVAPPETRARLQLAAEATTICPSVLSQLVVHDWVAHHDWLGHVARATAVYERRAAATLAALAEHLPQGTRWTTPRGGFFTWVELPHGLSGDDLLPVAVEHGVVVVPGSAFALDGSGRSAVRLAYSFAEEAVLEDGVRRLGDAVRALLAR